MVWGKLDIHVCVVCMLDRFTCVLHTHRSRRERACVVMYLEPQCLVLCLSVRIYKDVAAVYFPRRLLPHRY